MRGSIVKRGGRYYAVVRPRDPLTGRTRPVWRAAGTSRREADRLLARLLAEYAQEGTVARPGRLTLGQHLEDWLAAKATQARPRTVALYRTLTRTRIAPALGAMPLASVTPTVIRRYLQSDAATRLLVPERDDQGRVRYVPTGAPAAPRTVQLQYAILRAALQDAVDMELLSRNPAAKVRPPRGERRREPRRLTFEELAQFLGAAERVSPRYAPLFRLAAVTGLRVGSLLALEWRDVDLERGVVQVRVAKTQTSVQAMPIDADTVAALRRHRARQAEERLAAGPLWRAEGWVFPNEAGGAPRYRQVAGRELRRIVAAAGIGPVRMHDLRHTAGSRMLEAGVDPRTVADRLGHKDAAFFLRTYAGSLPSSHRRAADIMGEALRQALAHGQKE